MSFLKVPLKNIVILKNKEKVQEVWFRTNPPFIYEQSGNVIGEVFILHSVNRSRVDDDPHL